MQTQDVQFDDVRMPEGSHVLDFPLDSCLGLRGSNDLLRDKLHRHLVTGDGVDGHCKGREILGQGGERARGWTYS